jgi:hypothetical protein
MVAEGSWKKMSTADSKIIALTTQVANLKKKLGENDSKNGGKGKGKDQKNPTKNGKKDEGKSWQYTKVGDTIKCPETGATLKWCPHHGTGTYMPSDHNHKEWAENKRKCQEQWEQKRDIKRVKGIKIRSPTAINTRTRSIPASCNSALLFASHL